eukprot:5798955-Amphidinium_carterae.4
MDLRKQSYVPSFTSGLGSFFGELEVEHLPQGGRPETITSTFLRKSPGKPRDHAPLQGPLVKEAA